MGMQLEFRPDAGYALLMASAEAGMMRHEYVGTEHVLLGLLRQEGGAVVSALDRLGVHPGLLRDMTATALGVDRDGPEGDLQKPFTRRCMTVITESGREAVEQGHSQITAGDLLLGLLREGMGVGGQVLAMAGLQAEPVRTALRDLESAT